MSKAKKLSCVQFSLLHPLSPYILSLPFIYLYPFPHPLVSQQQLPPTPPFCMLRVKEKNPGCVPGSPLMHAQLKEREHKSTSIKMWVLQHKCGAGYRPLMRFLVSSEMCLQHKAEQANSWNRYLSQNCALLIFIF